jgi:hypothetical protein
MPVQTQKKSNAITADEYLAPDVPRELPWHAVPLKRATAESLKGYGKLVDDWRDYPIEIVTWPVAGWRQCDPGTGNEGGTTHGQFDFWWEGDVLYGKNQAVNSQYLLGWSKNPADAATAGTAEHPRVLLWHANYHPDGGQLFFPLNGEAFVCPLALPGDDITPAKFVCFRFAGDRGLYIHPNIWHEGVFAVRGTQRFFDQQGAVHARVSVDFAREFGCLLEAAIE